MLLAAQPLAEIVAPPEALIGEAVDLIVSFDNASTTDIGFGPYIDLMLPATGVDGAGAMTDDGITFVSATYFGSPVSATLLVFDAAGQALHPIAVDASGTPLVISGTPGDQLVVLQLPFGSFAPDQPRASVNVSLQVSEFADLGAPLAIHAAGGFRFGNDALDNPSIDPSIVQSPGSTATITPEVFTLRKQYIGPEDETTTGPNFPRQYVLTVDIANGQTITNLDLTDVLPDRLQFLSVDGTEIRGTPTATTAISTPDTSTPGGTLTRRFASVTGTTDDNDATMRFSFFVPRDDASGLPVLDPATGDDVSVSDDARATGTWDPIDSRDPAGPITSDATPIDHTLTVKSVAVQKSVAVVDDTGAPGPSPGDTLEYSISFQVSDYFAFRDLIATDVFSDGQRIDVTFPPTLTLTEHGVVSSGDFASVNAAFVVDSPGTGSTTATFDISSELMDRGLDGDVLGGAVPDGGTGGPPPGPMPPFGATTGTIRYRTVIQQEFTDAFPSGDPSVDEGDVLSNSVSIAGNLLDTADLTPTGTSEADTSGSGVTIVSGDFSKSIYAINGSTGFASPVRVAAGDTVTFRLRYTLPTSDVETLVFDDYLPLPIFDAAEVSTFDDVVDASAPAAGRASFGPDDTFRGLSAIVPAITSDTTSNVLSFDFGTFDDPNDSSTVIDLLFTVTVSDAPFADGLDLTNQAQATQGSTNAGVSSSGDVAMIELTEPQLGIRKGVVATDRASATFTPGVVGPVGFSAPGSVGFRGSATISSGGLAAAPIDSNLRGVDAGDLVTFAVVVENTGSGLDGAFDVRVRDTLPSGFEIPSGGLNLFVSDGTGAPLSVLDLGGDPASGGLFGTGIEIIDPGTTPSPEGGLDPADPASGRNILVITYDLRVSSSVLANQALTNTANLFNYATAEGGPDFTAEDQDDDATVRVDSPTIDKVLVGTEIDVPGNSTTQAVIGELISYRVTITIPEGTTQGTMIVDTLDSGLAFVDFVPGFINSNPGAVSISGSTTPTITGSGRFITLDLGEVINSDLDNNTAETLTLEYRAVVLNVNGNQSGTRRNNSAVLSFSGGPNASDSAANVTIVEPEVSVTKSVLVDGGTGPGDAGDAVEYTITIRNDGSVDAFDVTFRDTLPRVPGGATAIEGSTPTAAPAFSVLDSAGILTTADFSFVGDAASGWTLQTNAGVSFDLISGSGRTITLMIGGFISRAAIPGSTLVNTAEAPFSSLNGDPGQRSAFNSSSTERDGSGGVNDYIGSGSASISITQLAPIKAIVATSEDHTGNVGGVEQLAIGEIVRYRLTVQIPEGTLGDVRLVDLLPLGLILLDPDQVRLSFVADADLTEPADLAGADNDAVPPTFVLPGFRIGTAIVGGRQSITFSLGDLINNDSDADVELLILEFNALVDNSVLGSNDAGDGRDNAFEVRVTGDPTNQISNTVESMIVEPSITDVAKAVDVTSGDAGDVITFTVSFSNTGTASAFDVRVLDLLPSTLVLDPMSVSLMFGGGASGGANNASGNTLDAVIAVVPVGGTVMVRYQATIAISAISGSTITNMATVSYSSLPGANGTTTNATGSSTPGAPGDADGERNGSGGINDYLDSATTQVTIASPNLSKVVLATNLANTTGNAVAIGELATYQVTITIPEGTSPLAMLADLLPAGLAIVGIDSIVADPALSTSIAGGFDAVLAAARAALPGGGGSMTIDFGTLTNADTDNGSAETIVVTYTVVVLNTAGNQDGATLVNAATFTTSNTTDSDAAPALNVVEPDLSVTKSASTATGDAGAAPITFTIVVSHTGISTVDAFDVLLTDVLPAEFDYVAGSLQVVSGASASVLHISGNTITIRFDTLPATGPGRSSTIEFQVIVNGSSTPGQLLTNTVDLTYSSLPGDVTTPQSPLNGLSTERTGDPGDPGGLLNTFTGTDSAGITLNTNSLSGFVFDDRDNDGVFELGESPIPGVTVTLTGTDNLGNPVTLAVMTDTTGFYQFIGLRPGSYTITEEQPSGFLDGRDTVGTQGGTLVAPDAILANLAPGTSTVGTGYNFGELLPASLSGIVYVDADDDGVLDPSESGIGGVTVTLTGTNDLGQPVMLVISTLPDGSYAFSALRPGTYAISESQPVIYVDGKDTPGTIAASVVPDAFTGIVLVPGSVGTGYLFGELPTADLSLTKRVDDDRPNLGQLITFTLTLTNDGPDATTGVRVSDSLPDGLVFVSALPSQGSYDDSTGVWDVGDLASGASATLAILATVTTSNPATNTAQVATSALPDPDSTPGNGVPDEDDQDSATITPQVADLSLTKTVDDDRPNLGQVVTFTLLLSNSGPDAATGVAVTDLLPPGLAFVSASPSRGTYASSTGLWTVGDLVSGASATLTILATVTGPGTTTNTAQVISSDQFDPDSTPGNAIPDEDDQDSATIIPQVADLSILKTVDDDRPNVGQVITFSLALTNAGPDAATGVAVTDLLPLGLSFVSAMPSQGNYDDRSGIWGVGTLPVGVSATLTILAIVTGPGTTTNTAQVISSDQFDPDSTPGNAIPDEDDQDSATIIPQVADLSLTKTVDDNRPNVGQVVTFTLLLSNAGPDAASGVGVTDQLPPGLIFVSASPSLGTYDPTAALWTVGSLAVDASATLTILAIVDRPVASTNTTQVTTSDQFDPDSTPANNLPGEDDQDSATISPRIADLSILKTVDDDRPNVGQMITFTLSLRNDGPEPANGVGVSDQLPLGLSFVSASPDQGSYDAGAGLWSVGTLPVGASATLMVLATVESLGTITNTAQVASSDQFDPDSTPGNGVLDEDDQDEAAILVLSSSISGSVFVDLDRDGIRQPGEPGLGGVAITLMGTDDLGGLVMRAGTTLPDGSYRFDGLPSGTYTVSESQPPLYADGAEHLGSVGGVVADDAFLMIPLGGGVDAVSYDFAELGGEISGSVFIDINNDARRQDNEPGIPGTTVLLTGTDSDGIPIERSTVTDTLGHYRFVGLPSGTFTIVEVQPDAFLDGGESAGPAGGTATDDRIEAIALAGGQLAPANDFGELVGASLAGYVYYDLDHDRTRTEGVDLGISGVEVILTGVTIDGASVMRVTATGPGGSYRFDDLRPGTYAISESQPRFFRDFNETVGSLGGVIRSNDRIDDIPVGLGAEGTGYNFGELQPVGCNLRHIVLALANRRDLLAARRALNPGRFDRFHPQFAPAFGAPARGIYRRIYELLPTLGSQRPITLAGRHPASIRPSAPLGMRRGSIPTVDSPPDPSVAQSSESRTVERRSFPRSPLHAFLAVRHGR